MPQLSMHTPLGDLTISEDNGAIVALDDGWGRDQSETPLLSRTRELLDLYFDGAAVHFDLPLAPFGTLFRQKVWSALQHIPYGHTRSYAALAAELGTSARAIGGACGANPIPILIPCHRVLGSKGLGGYSGFDGLEDKAALLTLEGNKGSF